MIRPALLMLALSCMLSAQEAAKPATEEKKAVALLDGKTLRGWVKADGKSAEGDTGWKIEEDGSLCRAAKSGDIFTEKEYGDFEFTWDWKVAVAGNSGVKYRVIAYGKALLGPEYQMLDDSKHADSKNPTHRTGCIYDLFPRIDEKSVKAAGEWNSSKIVAKGGKFEHWLNGALVAQCDTSTEEWKKAVAASKFKKQPDWALNPKGKIMLQDHGDQVWFKNLLIKEL